MCDAHGRLLTIVAPDTIECASCWSVARRHASVFQRHGTTHHHYRCETCPAGGTLVEHTGDQDRHRGPVFEGADSAIRLTLAYDPAKAERVLPGDETIEPAPGTQRAKEGIRS